MKKLNLSLVTVLAMSTFAFAGGDIAPVEPMIETPMVEEIVSTPGSFYVGAAYGMANLENSYTTTYEFADREVLTGDFDYDTVMLQAGYKFNQYVAIEGRYWFGMDEDVGATYDANNILVDNAHTLNIDTWGIYVKPMYPITEQFDIYGLLGYASTETERSYTDVTVTPDYDMDGFSWGLGGSYAFTENIAVFVDYVNMYDDTQTVQYSATNEWGAYSRDYDEVLSTVNFGVTYTF